LKISIWSSVVCVLFASTCFAGVGWSPGSGKSDPNWYGHYTHVTERGGKDSGLNLMISSVQELCGKLSVEDFGELYADLGVNIAKIGIRKLGWKPGKGMYDPDWYGHYTHVTQRASKEDGRDKLISWFKAMHGSLEVKAFGTLYADVMTRMASYGITR